MAARFGPFGVAASWGEEQPCASRLDRRGAGEACRVAEAVPLACRGGAAPEDEALLLPVLFEAVPVVS